MAEINCVIVHGCTHDRKDMDFNKHWMQWLRRELILNGIEIQLSTMPDPMRPSYEAFKKKFEKCSINENTVLVGHSCELASWLDGSAKARKRCESWCLWLHGTFLMKETCTEKGSTITK